MDDNFLPKKEKKSIFIKKAKDRQSVSIAPNFKCPLADIIQAVGNGTNNNIINININTNQQPPVKIIKNKNRHSVLDKKMKPIDEIESKRAKSPKKLKKKISTEKINKKEDIKSPNIQKKTRKESCVSPSKHKKK